MLVFTVSAHAETAGTPLSWLNSTRAAQGLRGLDIDGVLMDTARAHAENLAVLGRISHIGSDGSDALTRYLRGGGTSAMVGEIIGAGETLPRIEAAWLSSTDHRAAILAPFWTHVGWGSAVAGGQQVWVILFAERRVDSLVVSEMENGSLKIEGIFLPNDVERPVLFTGTVGVEADVWDPGSGLFRFLVPAGLRTGYIRLGYVARGGGLVITDVITSPRGTESPTAGSRS
jgi:hypothetical protein